MFIKFLFLHFDSQITFLFSIGVTGNVTIDDNGDRSADYSLLDMDPNTGNFRVIFLRQ